MIPSNRTDLQHPPQVQVAEVTDDWQWRHEGIVVTAAATDHSPVHPTIGFRVEAEGKVVAIAGDTVPCEGLNRLCADADIDVQTVIVHSFIETHPIARLRDVIDDHSDVVQAAQTAKACRVHTLVLNRPLRRPGTESAWIDLARARAFRASSPRHGAGTGQGARGRAPVRRRSGSAWCRDRSPR